MAWTLGGVEINAPHQKNEARSAQIVQHRTLDGSFKRAILGSEKRIFSCEWQPVNNTDFNTIIAQWESQRDTGADINLTIDQMNFNGNVLIELKGDIEYYLSNNYDYRIFKVIFYEA